MPLDNDLKETLELCYQDTGVFGKTFYPETFFADFTDLHNAMIEAIDGPHQRVCIAAPRGLGKTSTVRTFGEKGICYRDWEFILYCSQSEGHSIIQTENAKRNLKSSRGIKKIFGDIKISDNDEDFDESFSKKSWTAFGNTLVMPRGMGQQVRGLVWKRFRPQLMIVDDLEDRKELENPENRRKTKEWFYSDLMKCMDRYSDKWKVIYIDTLKHSESLLQELLNDPDWYSIRLDLCDDYYTSRVPQLISTEDLKKEAEAARRNGTLDIFYMEYRNMPVSKENQSFRQEYFKYYEERDLDLKNIESLVIVDPAKTVQIQNADSAIVGLGINYGTGSIYFRDCVSGKMYPDEIYEQMFEMALRLKSHVIGVEVTGLEEFIKQPILNEMQRRGPRYSFEIVWLKARGGPADGERGKIKRIGGLVPYYRQGFIYHNRTCCAKLESQLLSFPRSGLVDVADATSYVIEMMELGGRYFTVPDDKVDPNEDFDPEAEYALLDYDEPLVGYRRF